MAWFPTRDDSARECLAEVFHRKRADLSRALFSAVRNPSTATWRTPQEYAYVEEWGRAQILTAIDLCTRLFGTQDPLFRELFAGWVRSRMIADLSSEGIPEDYRPDRAIALATGVWVELIKPFCPSRAIEILQYEMNSVIEVLAKTTLKHLKILFIGDCIQYEATTALWGPCAHAQISISPTLLNEKVQPALRNRIRLLRPDQFDLVFYSPFSHRYIPEYEHLLQPKSQWWPRARIKAQVDAVIKEVLSTADALASHLDCKIYLHNTAGAIQSFGLLSGVAKNLMSWRNRGLVSQQINEAIRRHLCQPHISSDGRLHLLDEFALRKKIHAFALGRVYLDSYSFHPTRLGIEVGRNLYFQAVYVNTFLAGKKVLVCDLDNTLWDGVIGEGPVKHLSGRQEVLKDLKNRGVLLSINSKNDPKNVHWSGAMLELKDFVAPQINWEPKVTNMVRIRDELNLKLKDFVFIDDRPDELERMRNAYPEVVVLDATKPATWELLSHWRRVLPLQEGQDRTTLYHERVRREQFVKEQIQCAPGVEDETSTLKSLGLSVKVREAARSDLKRAVDLINRSNQFNLNGSRTSLREIQNGLGSAHSVIVAEASDKFGQMGMVGVMLAEWGTGQVAIPIFVLSCRVFGFGIEYALLHALKNMAPGDYEIVGYYKETQLNEPCRQLYPRSGLSWEGRFWIGKVSDLPADPIWLAVQHQTKRMPGRSAYAQAGG